MGSRPTISDLARAAGVSVATVDRVINRRSPVRDFTARRVLAAAQDIGFEAGDLDLQRADQPASKNPWLCASWHLTFLP